MTNTIFIILKKELLRFFGDRRMVVTTVILPGFMIFFMYTFMASALSAQYKQKAVNELKVWAVDMPENMKEQAKSQNWMIVSQKGDRVQKAKQQVQQKKIDLLLIFPKDFTREVKLYTVSSGKSAPQIQLYYNSAKPDSQNAYMVMTKFLEKYESTLVNKFDVNSGNAKYDLATNKDTASNYFASMLPMLILMFLFSGCVSVAPESIAGEKERGTMATLLVTPVKRSHIAVGKIMGLSFIALLSGLSSTLGTIVSLPKIMEISRQNLQANVYGLNDYLQLLAVVLTTVLLMVTIISIISAYAKTTKEAQTYVSPLMILILLAGISAMFGNGPKTNIVYYVIPLYNSVQLMVSIFSFAHEPIRIMVGLVSNIIWTAAGVFALTRMFQNEKIIFTR